MLNCDTFTASASCHGNNKPDNDILHFTRFIAQDQENGTLIRKGDIDKFTINVLRRTIFVITDVMGQDNKDNYKQLIKNYFDTSIVNLFVVTRNMNTEVKYKLTIKSFVHLITDYIMELFTHTKETYLDLHLIGYKSGVDVAGLVGRKIAENTGRRIPRITGLNPLYDQYPSVETLNLNENDAEFVDVTHTNLKNTDNLQKMGHVDFYPNGGLRQTQCQTKQGKFWF